MKLVSTTPAGGPYRDATPGIQARLADLRTSWDARAAEALAARAAEVSRLATAIARARAFATAEILLVALLLTFWLGGLAASFDPPAACGHQPPGVLPAAFFFLAILLVPLRILAVRGGVRRARADLDRVLAFDAKGATSAAELLERLVREEPAARLAGFVARLEQQRRVWSLVARGLVLVLVPFLLATGAYDPAALLDAACLAVFPLAMLALGLLAALAPRYASGRRGAVLVGVGVVLTYVASFFHPAASLLALVQSWVMIHGLIRR